MPQRSLVYAAATACLGLLLLLLSQQGLEAPLTDAPSLLNEAVSQTTCSTDPVPDHAAQLRRDDAMSSIKGTVVFASGAPLQGCRVAVTGTGAIATTDANGDFVAVLSQALDSCEITVDWGADPVPFRFARPADAGNPWDLGRLSVPVTSLLEARLVIAPDAWQHLAYHREGRVEVTVALAGSLMFGRTVGGVQHVMSLPLTAARDGPVVAKMWLPWTARLEAMVSWRSEHTRLVFPIRRLDVLQHLPDRYEPIVVDLATSDLVCGDVRHADGLPADSTDLYFRIDALFREGLGAAYGRTSSAGTFAFPFGHALTGTVQARAGDMATASAPFAAGQSVSLYLPIQRSERIAIRIVNACGEPVARAGLHRVNWLSRTADGRADFDDAFLLEHAPPTAEGCLLLGVGSIKAGERWFVASHEYGETAYTFTRDLRGGDRETIPVQGDAAGTQKLDIAVPANGLLAESSELFVEETDLPPGRKVPARYWPPCRAAFAAGRLVVHHVYPGRYQLRMASGTNSTLPSTTFDVR